MSLSAEHATHVRPLPFRRTFLAVESVVAVSGLAGAIQLWDGTYAPPVSNLDPLGLDSWRLPAVWLFATVAVPSGVAAASALRRGRRTPALVIVASGLLLVEVTVQIPFVGPSVLQAAFGGVALAMGALAVTAQRSGGWRSQGVAAGG
jgi:hypothetical protein